MDLSLRQLIADDLKERQDRHPSFSLRAYARYLGVNPTSLSLFLNNKRNLSQDSILSILNKLDLGLLAPKANRTEGEPQYFEELGIEEYCKMSDWYYFAILSIMETEDFVSSCRWIAKRLGIKESMVESAIGTLHNLGMIRISEDGKFEPTGKQYKTPDEIRSFLKKRSHLQAMDLAAKSVNEDTEYNSDFSAMTMAIDPSKIVEAKEKIKEFRRSLCKFLETGPKKEVYRISIQLFPLSK